MKIIKAKRSGMESVAYINATRINSFLALQNPYSGAIETKIYFTEGKCEIEGDKTAEIATFMSTDDESGILDLVPEKSGFWAKGDETNCGFWVKGDKANGAE